MSVASPPTPPVVLAELIPPEGDRTTWIAKRGDGTLLHVGADAASLLEQLTSGHHESELAGRLGRPWTPERVTEAVAGLRDAGLVGVANAPLPAAHRRLRWVPPASLQLTVIDGPHRLNGLGRRLGWVTSRPFVALQLAIGVAGLAALAAAPAAVADAATSPLSPMAIAAVVLLTVFVTSLHELAHGATLIAAGGHVRRFGVMTLYVSLAFFCDVTDAWLLSSRRAARNVALAGGLASVAVAGLASIAALFASGVLDTVLTLVALTTFVGALLNLIPLVKFDGYVALVLALGESNLRRRSMDAWVDALAGRHSAQPPAGWSRAAFLAFGVCCSAFPLVLVGAGAVQCSRALAQFGQVGAIAQLALAALVAGLALHQAHRLLRRSRERGLRARVPALAVAVLVAAALGAGLLAPSRRIDTIPFSQRGTQVRLAVGVSASPPKLAPGQLVELRTAGLVASRAAGSARVVAASPTRTDVPAAVRSPAVTSGGQIRVATVAATAAAPASARVGYAHVDRGATSLLERAYDELVATPLRAVAP